MFIDKILMKVNNLNEYISVTQDVAKTAQCSKLQFNMSTVLCLKKVRALEIEYFNKCEGNGAALRLFEQIIELPPSKTWAFLGKELISLLQYWLDAMRKHLIKHNHNWWSFMNVLVKLIKLIRLKDQSLPNILVDHTTECLFDLATMAEPDILQRLDILCCLNLCCADASREKRYMLKDKLEPFFTKLSARLASCSHLPTQFSIVETLLRWLLPRHDPAVRQAAALKWFPEDVFGKKAVQIFLERPWQYFFQDARDFLNAFNEKSDEVVSILCRKLYVGSTLVASVNEKSETWLDINTADNSISILLDPRILDAIGFTAYSWESLIIAYDNILNVQLCRESSEITLFFHTTHEPQLSSGAKLSDGCLVRAVLANKGVQRLDRILRSTFSGRYKAMLDLDSISHSMSPVNMAEKKTALMPEEDSRFSHSNDVQKRKRSGYMVKSKYPQLRSPSTASTSSLAQLHEKLELLPRYQFEKEAANVCALPNLSTVTEVSESDDRQSIASASTIKIYRRPFGVCQKNKTQSDSEVLRKPKLDRNISPVIKEDENSVSCLLVATVGSDESVINDTLERITKSKDFHGDNIVDLLVKEALQNEKDKFADSGINTGDNKKTQEPNIPTAEAAANDTVKDNTNAQTIENHPNPCTIVSNTTTDESNDVVYDTPACFVNVRRRQRVIEKELLNDNVTERPAFDENVVETFFNEHLNENNRGEIVISPTLARKINETSSDSEQFDDCPLIPEPDPVNTELNEKLDQIEINDDDVFECLNNILDIVCNDLDKCTEILDKDCNDILNTVVNENTRTSNDTVSADNSMADNAQSDESTKTKPKRQIKLKYTFKRLPKPKKTKNKLHLEVAPDVSTNKDTEKPVPNPVTTPESKISSDSKSNNLDEPLIRRKRKLYSPKAEDKYDLERKNVEEEEKDSDFKFFKTKSKYFATSYKDIEKDRANQTRRPRARQSRKKSESTSPRTIKMNNMFDHLKDKVESNDSVMLADKTNKKDVYNLTSDSEDEDFKKKKLELRKRISSTTVVSADSMMSTRRGRKANRINYSENKSSDETIENRAPKQKKNTRRKKQTKAKLVKKNSELIDEKMRGQVQEQLNTSLIIEKPVQFNESPKFVIEKPPELEPIQDEAIIKTIELNEKPKKTKKADALSLRKEKLTVIDTDNNRTESPLPGLVVETMPVNIDDGNDSISVNMLQKFKKIYQDGYETCNNETNTTQNLLSDMEKTNYSPTKVYTIDTEINQIQNYEDINVDTGLEIHVEKSKSPLPRSQNESNIIHSENTERLKRSKKLNIKQENRAKSKGNKKSTEVIEISEISDNKSEISIATVGKSPITAHGDNKELPPNSESLSQQLKPRDLEVEYLDDSMKEYYNNLTKEIQGHANVSSNSEKTPKIDKSPQVKSPTVSITRLSIDDISKWLPSRRNSDSDSSYVLQQQSISKKVDSSKEDIDKSTEIYKKNSQTQKKIEIQDNSNEHYLRRSQRLEKKVSESISEKSDCDSVIVKPAINQNKDSTNYDLNSSKSDIEEILLPKNSGTLKEFDAKIQDMFNKIASSVRKSFHTPKLKKYAVKKDVSPVKINRKIVSTVKVNKKDVSPVKVNRKSMISPLAMFDDSRSRSRLDSTYKTPLTDRAINSSGESKQRKLDLGLQNDSAITSTPEIKLKTDSPPSKINVTKKRKLEEFDTFITLAESGQSASSVNDWFARNAQTSRDLSNTSISETIQNIMEKLDTTLEEIHQNTSRKFVFMFVEAQKQLSAKRQERREMFRGVASEILSDVARLLDNKFADLDRRSQQLDAEFMQQLKAQATEFIREDCKKKQLMTNILKEDVQAVLDHVDKKTRRS